MVAADGAAVAGVGAEVLEGGLDVVEVVRPEEGDAVGVGAGEAECLGGEEGEDVVDGGDVVLEEAEKDGLELVPEELGRRAHDGGEDLRVECGEGGEEAEGLVDVVLEAAEDVVEDGGGRAKDARNSMTASCVRWARRGRALRRCSCGRRSGGCEGRGE